MQPTVAVSCTRAKRPGRNDWNKSVRLVKFLNDTIDDKLMSSAERGSCELDWCIDAAFAAHPDFRSHTGHAMKFYGGEGGAIDGSSKQKLNTESSTTSEAVGVDDTLPLVEWTPLFLEEQNYDVIVNRASQDNKSAMLLEENGKRSSGKRTRALNTRHFAMTD